MDWYIVAAIVTFLIVVGGFTGFELGTAEIYKIIGKKSKEDKTTKEESEKSNTQNLTINFTYDPDGFEWGDHDPINYEDGFITYLHELQRKHRPENTREIAKTLEAQEVKAFVLSLKAEEVLQHLQDLNLGNHRAKIQEIFAEYEDNRAKIGYFLTWYEDATANANEYLTMAQDVIADNQQYLDAIEQYCDVANETIAKLRFDKTPDWLSDFSPVNELTQQTEKMKNLSEFLDNTAKRPSVPVLEIPSRDRREEPCKESQPSGQRQPLTVVGFGNKILETSVDYASDEEMPKRHRRCN